MAQSGLRAYYRLSAKKRKQGHIQHSNTVPLSQLLHIAAPIRVEQIQNQNWELPVLERESRGPVWQ